MLATHMRAHIFSSHMRETMQGTHMSKFHALTPLLNAVEYILARTNKGGMYNGCLLNCCIFTTSHIQSGRSYKYKIANMVFFTNTRD